MNTFFHFILQLALVLYVGQALAANEVYKKVDKDGRVIYSDSPIEGAEVMQLAPIKTYAPPPLPENQVNASTAPTPLEEPKSYKVEIVSPEQNSFIPVGTPDVDVKVFTTPALFVLHRLQLKYNDELYGPAQTANTFTIKDLTNGSHTIQAFVVHADDESRIISASDIITISTKRSFLGNPLLPSAPQMPKAPQAPIAPRAP